jgi:hypothetical protein
MVLGLRGGADGAGVRGLTESGTLRSKSDTRAAPGKAQDAARESQRMALPAAAGKGWVEARTEVRIEAWIEAWIEARIEAQTEARRRDGASAVSG